MYDIDVGSIASPAQLVLKAVDFGKGYFVLLFQWDEKKRQRVIAERNIDMLYAALIFEGPVLTGIDEREDYGEVRKFSIGMVDGECFVVVHTERKGETRLITAWKGGREEHDRYEESVARSNQGDEGSG